MEHFVAKKLANAFPKQVQKYAEKKMNIVAAKYLQTITVKIMHESFFFQIKHTLTMDYFSFIVVFFQTFFRQLLNL